MEDQAAVLKAMRDHCEVRMREERRLLKQMRTVARVRNKVEVTEGDPSNDGQDPGFLLEESKVRSGDSAEQRDTANHTKENESRARRNENQVIRENGSQSLKENGSVATYCPTTFDDVYCWPRTPPDTLVTIPCPTYVQGFLRGVSQSKVLILSLENVR